jgi:hypothetical protein
VCYLRTSHVVKNFPTTFILHTSVCYAMAEPRVAHLLPQHTQHAGRFLKQNKNRKVRSELINVKLSLYL